MLPESLDLHGSVKFLFISHKNFQVIRVVIEVVRGEGGGGLTVQKLSHFLININDTHEISSR